MQSDNLLSIIIPVRSEEASIISTLEDLTKEVKFSHEIIVVDDSVDKDDETAKKAFALAKKHKNIKVIFKNTVKDTDGFAGALKRGIAAANGESIIFVMADHCDDFKLIDKMHAKLLSGFDVVGGTRYAGGGKKVGGPWLQGLFSGLVNRTLHHLTGIPTTDVSNAFKMYRTLILRKVKFNEKSGVECSIEIIFRVWATGGEDYGTSDYLERQDIRKFKI